ncbi:MAG: hypothetical protein PF505_13250 [Vallitaleaceae bacterium]|jgi:hypothetical protein|nr:hypothetical protein [Vallitaleaceae bacterium]
MKKLHILVLITALISSIILGKYYVYDVQNRYSIVLNGETQTRHYIDIYTDDNGREYFSEVNWFAEDKKIDSEVVRLKCGDYKYFLFYNSGIFYRTRSNAFKETSTIFPVMDDLIRPYIVYRNGKTYYAIDLIEGLIWDNVDNIKRLGFDRYGGNVEIEITIDSEHMEIIIERYSWIE